MPILDHLEPRAVFSYFELLCAIPHGSGSTKEISDYLGPLLRPNIICAIFRTRTTMSSSLLPARRGTKPPPRSSCRGIWTWSARPRRTGTKDMAREGLDLFVDGDTIGARGTTLGGDDGIAVAMALAILGCGRHSPSPARGRHHRR